MTTENDNFSLFKGCNDISDYPKMIKKMTSCISIVTDKNDCDQATTGIYANSWSFASKNDFSLCSSQIMLPGIVKIVYFHNLNFQ